jgi:alginate O-acetyltransferase complex protein AlgI
MVFSSPIFLFIYLPIVFMVYKVLPVRLKNYFLMVVSLFFYAWGEPLYIILMIVSVTVNYVLARLIGENAAERPRAKLWLLICVIYNIGMLFVFKYSNFFVDNVNGILGTSLLIPVIRLPIGISFYTFQAMSYVIDVYRGTTKPQKSLTNVLLYVSFFPQLIAGPIVIYYDIALQIENRIETVQKTVDGLKRFTVGLGKKLLLANAMGGVADQVYGLAPSEINIAVAWLGAITYALQIYFDFSGYSDMAIGMAHMFGFDLKENFNYPYMANSIKDFWRKWHISLSTWFKEYLYVPLGGNRKGMRRTAINLIIVFFCTGLWHGAQWTFVVWGFFHGLFIMLEKVGVIKPEKFKPKWLANVYTVFVAVIAFVIFRAETLTQGFDVVAKMFTGFTVTPAIQSFLSQTMTGPVIVFGILSLVGTTNLAKRGYLRLKDHTRINGTVFEAATMAATLMILSLCILTLASQTYNPFIYFRF